MNFAFIILQHEGRRHGIGRLPTEDLARSNERLSALELLQDERVANLRQGPFSPISCDEHRVAVDPADGLLSLRKSETGRDEGVGVQVELSSKTSGQRLLVVH